MSYECVKCKQAYAFNDLKPHTHCPKCANQLAAKGIVIVCEHVPAMAKGQDEAQLMKEVEDTLCKPRCGYYRDAGTNHLQISCFNPASPYLDEMKKQLGIPV
jgi:DNA-directed RNA polymerase subunit RPC12/RpoP